MSFRSFLFIFLAPLFIFADPLTDANKPCTEEELKELSLNVNELRQQVVDNLGSADIEAPILQIEEMTNLCGLTPERFALNKNVFAFWKQKNERYQKDHQVEILNDISLGRPLTEAEAKAYLATQKTAKEREQAKMLIHSWNLNGEKNQIENKQLCFPEFDLTEKFGPVKNQSDAKWCASYAASDLVAFHLELPVSAIDMALNAKDTLEDSIHRWLKRDYEFDGTGTRGSILDSQKTGFCVDPDVVAVDFKPPPFLKATITQIGQAKYNLGKNVPRERMADEYSVFKKVFPSARLEDFYKIYAESTANSFIHEARRQTCKKRLTANFQIVDFQAGDWRAFNQALSGPAPAAILTSGPFLQFGSQLKDPDHVVLVIGRKFNAEKNQCEYKIRNSWGSECGIYAASRNCEAGNLRLPASELRPALRDGFTLRP